MSGVINDVDALTEFRAHLVQFNRDLAENFATIRGHWRELGEVWRDDMYGRFGEALDEVTPGITQYLSATEAHEAHLGVLIDRLGSYLETGLGGGSGGGLGAGRGSGSGGGLGGGRGSGSGGGTSRTETDRG